MKKEKAVWFASISVILLGLDQRNLSAGSTFDQDEWTPWSHQTPCSRPCDGGITQQFRRCKSPNGCHGPSVRRKMCNMQPCFERKDYRKEQCEAFNGVKYRGLPRNWEPVEDPQNPCANTCRAQGTTILAKLSAKLKDGTRCKSGGLHVCVNGICEAVGCDLRLGSPKIVDECGICGGDGKTCTTVVYRWAVEPKGLCSASCGGGQQEVKVICKNSISDEDADELLCNSAQKPYRAWQTCNIHPCDPTWEMGEWSQCSVTCGGGMRIRRVYCAQEKNATKNQVAEKLCQHTRKPPNQEPCNSELCPHWHGGPWSACSVTCGNDGVRTRNVVCRDAHNLPASTCAQRLRPPETSSCDEMPPCPTSPMSTQPTEEDAGNSTNNVATGTALTTTQSGQTETFLDLDYFETEELPREHTLPLIQPYGGFENAVLFDHNAVPSEPTFVAEPWGACSTTCGQGVRKRQVTCKIFLEFTRTVASLPDKECYGPKPPATESCFSVPCHSTLESSGGESLADSHQAALADSDSSNTFRKTVGFGLPPGLSIQDMSFSWKVDGFGPCSASCLGGVQERRIVCVRDYDQRAATPVLCMDKPRPDIPTTRTCNDHPCPPRWNVTDFGPCSKPCGGGVMTREVSCIHEVTRGNTVTVPNTQCPHPTPRTEMLCSAISCPPYWETSDWGKCSKACGGGERTRTLRCRQVIALGQIVERHPPESFCTQPPPPTTRICNKKACASSKGAKDWKPKMSLKVKGEAKVFNGVTLKLRCPATSAVDPTKIVWMKDHSYIQLQGRKVEILPKGMALKIKNTTFSDSGVYTCLYQDRPISNISLMIQPVNRVPEMPQREPSGDADVSGPYGRDAAHSTLYADEQTLLPMWIPHFSDLFYKLKSEKLAVEGKKLCRNGVDFNSLNEDSSCEDFYWKSSEWTNCSIANCFTWNTATRSRQVTCHVKGMEQDETTSEERCHGLEKPKSSEECYNDECKGVWATTPWTECKALCGNTGMRTRILRCVWFGTEDRPAGNACQTLPRPPVTKPCKAPPCSKNILQKRTNRHLCKDKNGNCAAIGALDLCHLKQFVGLCCATCSEDRLRFNSRKSD